MAPFGLLFIEWVELCIVLWNERFRMGLDRKVEMLVAALATAENVLPPGSSISRAIIFVSMCRGLMKV